VGTAPKRLSFPKNILSYDEFVAACAKIYSDRLALSFFENGEWQFLSYADLYRDCDRLAGSLNRGGLKQGDRVAILSQSSLEWVKHYFAALFCGAIVIPLDHKLTKEELQSLVQHCEPQFIFTSNAFRETARELRHSALAPAKVFNIESPWDFNAAESFQKPKVDPDSLAVICYTSGTLGQQKGVEITPRMLLFNAEKAAECSGDLDDIEVVLSILPLNHLYGLCAGLLYCMRVGFELNLAHDITPEAIRKCIVDRRPTQFFTVPLFVKTVMRAILDRIKTERGKESLQTVMKLVRFSKYLPKALRNKLFAQIREGFGGRLKHFVCGGAELDPETYDFFQAVNIPAMIGYGLTETGPVITVNTPSAFRRGSVGKPLPEVEVRIAKEDEKDGEILTRGAHVTKGYFKNQALTSQVFNNEGWFHTGDLGYFDKDGYLFVSGRKKSLIVLSSGKKIHPEEVELAAEQSPHVRMSCVAGLKTAQGNDLVIAVVLPTDSELSAAGNDFSELERRVVAE
jgi:long-chain acyl-CoA synthetase